MLHLKKIIDKKEIKIRILTDSEKNWHSAKNQNYMITNNCGFLDRCHFFKVNKDGRYYDGFNIGASSGSNLGTASILIKDLKTFKILANKHKYKIL